MIFGTLVLCGPGKKPIVLCVDLMNINEWAGLNAKISSNYISITVSRFEFRFHVSRVPYYDIMNINEWVWLKFKMPYLLYRPKHNLRNCMSV